VCRRCDRGQICCGLTRRREARRHSQRAARARHQASEPGWLDRRDHQRACRARIERFYHEASLSRELLELRSGILRVD
jgi:hypothetical protein